MQDSALFDWIVLQTGHVTRGTVWIKHDVVIEDPAALKVRLQDQGWRVTIFASTSEISLFKPNRVSVGNPKSEVTLRYHTS